MKHFKIFEAKADKDMIIVEFSGDDFALARGPYLLAMKYSGAYVMRWVRTYDNPVSLPFEKFFQYESDRKYLERALNKGFKDAKGDPQKFIDLMDEREEMSMFSLAKPKKILYVKPVRILYTSQTYDNYFSIDEEGRYKFQSINSPGHMAGAVSNQIKDWSKMSDKLKKYLETQIINGALRAKGNKKKFAAEMNKLDKFHGIFYEK